MKAPAPQTAWTHLNWLETLEAVEAVVGDAPLDVTPCPDTHGLRVVFGGVQTTLHGLNTLEAQELVAHGNALISREVVTLLSRSLTAPDVTVRLSDHPEHLELRQLDEVLQWTHLPVQWAGEGVTLTAQQRRSLRAVHHSAVRSITRASGAVQQAHTQLGISLILTLTLTLMAAAIPFTGMRMVLGLLAAASALRLLSIYNQKNSAVRVIKKTEDNLKRGLALQGLLP